MHCQADGSACSFVLVDSSRVALPISPITRALTLLLPGMAAVNWVFARIPERVFRTRQSTSFIWYTHLSLQMLQGIVTVVLSTLYSQGILASPDIDCSLHTRWQQLWRTHDSRSIESIQDAFACCGFLSLRDMSEPHRGTDTTLCAALYQRSIPCAGPWSESLYRHSGLGLVVAVAVGVLQVRKVIRSKFNIPQI
jgi:hypothetical protein